MSDIFLCSNPSLITDKVFSDKANHSICYVNWGKCDVFQLHFMKNIDLLKFVVYFCFMWRCRSHVTMTFVVYFNSSAHPENRPNPNPNHKPKQNFKFPNFQRSTCHSILVHFHSFYGSYFCLQNLSSQLFWSIFVTKSGHGGSYYPFYLRTEIRCLK